MSVCAPATLLSSSLAGTLRKRNERSAKLVRLHVQIGDVIHGEAEAALGERRQAFVLDRAESAIGLLRELEHQRGCERAIGIHEIEELPEHHRIGESRGADIAEQADVAALQQQAARHLHAAEHRKIVDLRHQADAFGDVDEIDGRNDVAIFACAAATSLRSSAPCAAAA